MSTLDDAARNWNWFLQNASERAWRFAAAPALTLGMFFILPVLHPRRSFEFVRAHPEWAYYIVVSLALAPIGGGDFDRFAFVLAPALAVIVAVTVELDRTRAIIYSLLQVCAVRFGIPTQPDEPGYVAFNVATMELSRLAILVGVAALILLLTWAIDRRIARSTRLTV